MKTVFVVGTRYSGSGCVLDWLREQNDIPVYPYRPFDFTYYKNNKPIKIVLYKFMYNIVSSENLLDKVQHINNLIYHLENYINYRKSLFVVLKQNLRDLIPLNVKFTLRSIIKRKKIDKAKVIQNNPEIKSKQRPINDAIYTINFLKIYLEELKNNSVNEKLLWNKWFNDITFTASTKLLSFDKSFPYDDYNNAKLHLEIFKKSMLLVVLRDPLDQMLSWYKSYELIGKDNIVIDNLEQIMAKLYDDYKTIQIFFYEFHERIKIVYFEEFVLEHERVANEIADWIDFKPVISNYSVLDLSISSKNINIQDVDAKIIELIKSNKYYSKIYNLRYNN